MTRRLAIAALLFLALATSAEAQDPVALRFYIVPKAGTGAITDPIRPKYILEVGAINSLSAMNYGLEDTFLLGVVVTNAQHTTLASNLDVIAIPQDIDSAIGLTALQTVKDKLEGLNIPSDWVTVNHTYRQAIGIVGRAFLYMQRFNGRQLRKFFETGIALDTRVNQLTQAQRDAMNDAAVSLGLSTATITGPMTLRQALRIILEQLPSFSLAGQTF